MMKGIIAKLKQARKTIAVRKSHHLEAERETTYSPLITQAASSSHTTTDFDTSTERMGEHESQQEASLLDYEISFNEAVIEKREKDIEEIQNDIEEINEIYKDIAVLIREQGPMPYNINSYVEGALAANPQGKFQLINAAKTQRSNNFIACFLLVIFGIVILIVIVVITAQKKIKQVK